MLQTAYISQAVLQLFDQVDPAGHILGLRLGLADQLP